ncbi:MAG: hypothetical protein NWP98_09470, partial [Erythrobacter sp.]|nr:hypothetical protein [Erythrobacter sp.]
MTSARARLLAATLLTAAAHPASAATSAATSMWSGFSAAWDGGVTIALFVPPIVLISFSAASVLAKRHHSAKPGAMRGAGLRHKALRDARQSVIHHRRDPPKNSGDTASEEAAEIVHVTNPLLGMLRQMGDSLGAIAGLIGTASGTLAAISRGSPPGGHGVQAWRRDALSQASSVDLSASDDPSIAAAIRSESAFVLGAAQSLEASIGDAADAINELAEMLSSAAASALSASDLSARAADVLQVAAVSLTRLDDTALRIAEIAAFIEMVASQTQQATAITFASVANIIGGAVQAQQSIDEASSLIAKLHDTMWAVPENFGSPAQETRNMSTPVVGARAVTDHLAQSLSVMQQRSNTTTDSAATPRQQARLPVVQDDRSVDDVIPVDRLPCKLG